MALKFLEDYVDPNNLPTPVRELPTRFLNFPQHSVGPNENSKPFFATIEQYIHALLQSHVVGYGKNRGGAELTKRKILEMFGESGEKVLVESLGEFLLADSFKDEGAYTLATHHHRSALLLYFYWKSSEEEWRQHKSEKISFRVFENSKLAELYCAADNMTKHPQRSFIRNSDMVMGTILSCEPGEDGKYQSSLAKILNPSARQLIFEHGGYLGPLATLIYVHCEMSKKGGDKNLAASHASLYNCRGRASSLLKRPYNENKKLFPVSDDFLSQMRHAIEDFVLFRSEFQKHIDRLKGVNVDVSGLKKILNFSGFFTFYIQDKMFLKQLPSAFYVAERLVYHCNSHQDLGGEIAMLWNSGEHFINKRADKITEVLQKKIKKVS